MQPSCATLDEAAARVASASATAEAVAAGRGAGAADGAGGLIPSTPGAALEEEARRRGGSGGCRGYGVPVMREISAAQLTAGREKLLASTGPAGCGAAFGPDYEAKLRAAAGDKPSDVARRKHQIGSLLHDAKLMELKALEGRISQTKSKQQTRAKYGW
jgi:proline-rich protein PRCC